MKSSSSSFGTIFLLLATMAACLLSASMTLAFTPTIQSFRTTTTTTSTSKSSPFRLYSTPEDRERQERLKSLGYSADEIKQAMAKDSKVGGGASSSKEDIKVRVDLVDDVDPLTLTAIGFALIAFNFLVLGNLGDGGIGGLVATAINLLNQ